MNLIKSPFAKAIVAAIGAVAAFLELSLTPHTTGYVIVGAIIAALTPVGVYLQGNTDSGKEEATS